jgi:radical SAM protein with 4Fe4S-binding SPASM domain
MRGELSKIHRKASLARFVFPRGRAIKRLSNIVRNELEFRAGKVKLGSMPYALFLDVACMCTLRCPLCYLGQGMEGRPQGIMSMETFCRVVDEFRDYAIVAHLCIRGEPLMNKQLPEMIAYAESARLMTIISTNLNLLDEKTADQLIESGLKKVVISFDGATEETYKIYRVGGDFTKVLKNIDILKRVKRQKRTRFPRIVLQFLIFRFNLHEVPKIRELARSLEVELSLQQGCVGGPGYEPYTGKHSQEVVDHWIVPPEVFLKAASTSKDRPSTSFDYYRNEETLCDEKCSFLWKTAYINWDGSVSPCCFVYQKDRDVGNIHQESFRRIWNNRKFQHARSLFLDSSAPENRETTICDSCRMYKQSPRT